MEQMSFRHLPDEQVARALREGERKQERKGEYLVKWNKWTIKVAVGTCFLVLVTAFRD
jgi:hypothetical protein